MSYMQRVSGELELSEVEKLSSLARSCQAGPGAVRKEGEYFVAVEPNSFGLPPVDTCPGKTDYCEQDCYAIESTYRTATDEKLIRNMETLTEDPTVEGMEKKLLALMDLYTKRADTLGIGPDERYFRIHWSGDFFSVDNAEAWRRVIVAQPDIKFWAYTRSFQQDANVVPILAGIENLQLFLSVDFQNVDTAKQALEEHPDVRVAYLVDYGEDARELAEILGRTQRRLPCPENMKDLNGKRRVPIISAAGGACSVCAECLNADEKPLDITFVKTGKFKRSQSSLFGVNDVPLEIKPRKRDRTKIAGSAGESAIAGAGSQGNLLELVFDSNPV